VAEVAVLTGHTERVYALAFVPGGHALLSAAGDHTTRTWETDDHQAADRICVTVSPPLHRTEWHQYFAGTEYSPVCP